MKRAVKFYQSVFGFQFEHDLIDGHQMALFPFADGKKGITGALAKGEVYQPTRKGVLLYFASDSIDQHLQKSLANGGQVLYPKTLNGEVGYVAEMEDSEGNRIGLHEPLKP